MPTSTGFTGFLSETASQFKDKLSQLPPQGDAFKVVRTLATSDTAKALKTGSTMVRKAFTVPVPKPTAPSAPSHTSTVKFRVDQYLIGTKFDMKGNVTSLPKYGGVFHGAKLMTDKQIEESKAQPDFKVIKPKDIPKAIRVEENKDVAKNSLEDLKKIIEVARTIPRQKVTFKDALKYAQIQPGLTGRFPKSPFSPLTEILDKKFNNISKLQSIESDLEKIANGDVKGFFSSLSESIVRQPEVALTPLAIYPPARPFVQAVVSGLGAAREIDKVMELRDIQKKLESDEPLTTEEAFVWYSEIRDRLTNRSFLGDIGASLPEIARFGSDIATGEMVTNKIFKAKIKGALDDILVRGTVVATAQPTLISKMVEENIAPEFQFIRDPENRTVAILLENDKDFIEATTRAFGRQWVENVTERMGSYMKLPKGVASKYLKQTLLSTVVKDRIRKSGVQTAFDSFKKATRWDGLIQEILEEEIGEPALALLEERRYQNPISTEEGRARLARETVSIAMWDGFLNSPSYAPTVIQLAKDIAADKSGKVKVGILLPGIEPPEKPKKESPLLQVESIRKVSGLARGVEALAVANKVIDSLDNLSEYDTIQIKDQEEKASALILEDYERAKRIAFGLEAPPLGVQKFMVFKTVEDLANKQGDINTIIKLSQSRLTTESSEAAQTLRILAERDPLSPVSAIRDIVRIREKTAEKRLASKKTTLQKERATLKKTYRTQIRAESVKIRPTKETWASFVQSIQC